MPLERHPMNLFQQEPTPRTDYRTKRPDKHDFCPICGKLKRKHGKLCKQCRRSYREPIPQPDDPFVCHIPLTNGQHAIVDAHLYEWLNQYRWQAWWNTHTRSYYAVGIADGKTVKMHRLIMGLASDDRRVGDHQNNSQTLDNRGLNLRLATGDQNAKNRRLNRNNTTGFKGVSRYKNRYRAVIYSDRKRIHLGTRDTARAAWEELYVPAAIRYHGSFARIE
jgi:hypothetical protein